MATIFGLVLPKGDLYMAVDVVFCPALVDPTSVLHFC
jgi:hypothetical protein